MKQARTLGSFDTSSLPREAHRRREPYRPSPHSLRNRLGRAAWSLVWLALFRPTPRVLHGWRRWLLRCFGAHLADRAVVYPSVRVWAPWNLTMGPHASLGPDVDCYCVDRISIGAYSAVSQYSFLCTAGHDIDGPDMRLTTAPIDIGAFAWIGADVFIGPGVAVGEGAVVGARSSLFHELPAWTVAVGNPARAIRGRSHAVAQYLGHGENP